MKTLTSSNNPIVKQLIKLTEKSSERKKNNCFVVEGVREIGLALKSNYQIITLYICPEIRRDLEVQKLCQNVDETVVISREIYQKIARRKTTEGLIALVKSKPHDLNTLVITRENPLILIVEAPEKPGNIGALLRTADAANLDAIIIANPKTDLYNPNIIRNSLGTLFTVPIAEGKSQEILDYIKKRNYNIYAAYLDPKSINYCKVDYKSATALVVGTEDKGLEKIWVSNSSKNIIIPMRGKIDSVNMSIATAIIIFEALRQRGF